MVSVGSIVGFFTNVWSQPEAYFAQPQMLYALGAALFVLILYLIRPKPRQKVFPSLMFLMGQQGKKKRNSFLQYLLRNLTLILQILALIFLALALAQPFMDSTQEVSTSAAVIVLDVSASMQTQTSALNTRFTEAKKQAKNYIADTTSLILAGRTPTIHVRDGDVQTVQSAIDATEPLDVATNIADAMVLAGELLQGQEGTIVVISDFLESDSSVDVNTLRSTLEARDYTVTFVPIKTGGNNVGIIDVSPERDTTRVFVRNFDKEERQVSLLIGEEERELTLPPLSTDVVAFTSPKGTVKVRLVPNDDFLPDNTLHLSMPEKIETRVLFITNEEEETSHLEKALASIPNVQLEKAIPPIVPEMTHDIIVLKDAKKDLFLKGKVDEIREAVEGGALFIIAMQDNLFDFDFYGLLPVKYLTSGAEGEQTIVNQDHPFMEDVSFRTLTKWTRFEALRNTTVLLRTDKNPLITFEPLGKGGVLFYGLFDEGNNFVVTPDYPVFWGNVIDEIQTLQSAPYLNVNTGRIVPFNEPTTVQTPTGKETTKTLSLSHTGVYTWDDIRMAANLLSVEESDIARTPQLEEQDTPVEESGETEVETTEDVTMYVLLIALAFIILELLHIKYRGDL